MKVKPINISKKVIPLLLISALGGNIISSCTDEVGSVELTKVSGSTDSVASVDLAKGMMLEALALVHDTREHKYQYQFNLHIDAYSGYLCVANNLEGRLPSTFFMNPEFESGPLSNFLWVARQVVPVMNSAESLKFPALGAMANILLCYSAQEVADAYGPMPYLDYKVLKQDPPMRYMPVQDIYMQLLTELKAASQLLSKTTLTPEQVEAVKFFDKIAGGDINNWVKFANTLRLRIAMHMKKADPATSRTEAEAAIRDGVLQDGDIDIAYNTSGGKHPLFIISDSWGDTRLNASFENILKRTGSPLLSTWFEANSARIIDINGKETIKEPNADYIGIRSGSTVYSKNDRTDAYMLFSKVSGGFAGKSIALMKVAEALFLRAEGALYGWEMGGSVQLFYETGIKNVLISELGDRIGAIKYRSYIAKTEPDDVQYVDYFNDKNNYAGADHLVQVGNKWDEADTNERKLERIMTQKYIANYPMSLESWTDIRRTGYPRLIPPVYDGGDNSITVIGGGLIRRLPFQLEGSVSRDDVFQTGIPALGNEGDYQGTRLWWDVNTPNF